MHAITFSAYWTPDSNRKDLMEQGPSESDLQFFLNFGIVFEIHMKFCVTEQDFF